MRREPSVLTLKTKLKMARRKVRELEAIIKEKDSEIRFREAALIRSSQWLAHLDKDGLLFAALMDGTLGPPKGAEK